MITEICNILSVEECRRVRMRLQFIADVSDPKEAMLRLASKFLLPEWVDPIRTSESTDGFAVVVGFQDGQIKVKLRAMPATVNQDLPGVQQRSISDKVNIIDVDLYQDGQLSVRNLANVLRDAERWHRDHFSEIAQKAGMA